jgi:ATP-dependent DNA ligase
MALDAEIFAFETGDRLSRRFSTVNKRSAARRTDTAQCVLFCFDILYLNGMNLRSLPYWERRAILLSSVVPSECVKIGSRGR